MKTIIKLIFLACFLTTYAQVDPILDHTWTIEKIVTEDETIIADLNAIGEYDQFNLFDEIEENGTLYYYFWFSSCNNYIFFEENDQTFYNHLLGCTLSEDSSDIAWYYNYIFIQESDEITLDNGSLPNAYGPFTFEFRNEGDLIYLDITNTNGEVATFWASTLSNDNFEEGEFLIYPNPVSDQLHIESARSQIQQVEIFNLNGKRVLNVGYQANQPIDVSSLAKGMYLVKVQTEDEILTKKLVKE